MPDVSVAELMVGRRLARDIDNARLRFAPGQHRIKRVTKTDAVASYVDRDGCLCIIPVKFQDNEWIGREVLIRIGLEHIEARYLPLSAKLNEEIMVLLTQPRRPAGQTT